VIAMPLLHEMKGLVFPSFNKRIISMIFGLSKPNFLIIPNRTLKPSEKYLSLTLGDKPIS
jgi:hypothetical protein